MLDKILRSVARRYRVPATPDAFRQLGENNPAVALAIAIEDARSAKIRGAAPDRAIRHRFLEALALMIRHAMRAEQGDPAFQAMALQHQAAHVREYASLSAHADQDRRRIRAAVNAVAHPAKQRQAPSTRQAEALAWLHAAAFSGSWAELSDAARQVLEWPEIANEPSLAGGIARVRDEAALERLRRIESLESDELVRQYRALRDRNGPRSGSIDAAAQGSSSRQRGAKVEAAATQALQALARRLDQAEGTSGTYRVAASLRVPASMPGKAERAKSEWDAVLLRKAETGDAMPAWDVCLLVEAKASVDAATTDFPRLLRGLRLLARADGNTIYPFETPQETFRLRGASLCALKVDEAELKKTVLYCCDAPAETTPRLLSSASRMQLLSAQASLEFANKLELDGRDADPEKLGPLWHELLESPRWRAVLHQYRTLHRVRELMVHIDDLMEKVDNVTTSGN